MAKKKKSLRSLKAKAWKLVSEYVRRADADEGGMNRCYTCGRLAHWTELHAGHFVPGRGNSVLFDERVIRPQCPVCNLWRGGAYHAYTLKMIDEVGREKVEELLALKSKVVKYSHSDLEDLIETYKTKLEAIECPQSA